MMMRLFLVLLCCIPFSGFAQTVSGIVLDDDQRPVAAVLVVNMKTEKKTHTDSQGIFTMEASPNEELRFIRQGFERNSKLVSPADLRKKFIVNLIRIAAEIEEVKIAYHATDDLKKDAAHFGDSKPVAKLKAETATYLKSKSTREVLAAKPGEFVQPVGPGFSVGGAKSQWDDVDFMQFLIKELDSEFFTDELKLTAAEIQPFIFYVFKNFERRDILFKGNPATADLARFISESYKQIKSYRQNLPNDPPRKKKRK